MAIDYVRDLPVDLFKRRYLSKPEPVVFSTAADAWPARKRWTPEYLREQWGETRIDHGNIRGSLSEVLDRVAASRPEEPQPYLKNLDIAGNIPGMLPDISPRLPHADPNWRDSRLLPPMIRQPGSVYELFVGGHGSRIPRLHYDEYAVNNFITQIFGTKEFWFYPPEAAEHLYPMADNPYLSEVEDPKHPDLARFRGFTEVEPIKHLLRPGETVYVAPGWWHWTWMPELSISVGTNSVNAANWSRYTREFTTAFGRAGRPKWVAFAAYLRVVGALKSLARS